MAQDVVTRDKEILQLKKELKKKEKKIKDLLAELKEALDMLKKAKWEAETSGGQDSVKEMVEEENEVGERWKEDKDFGWGLFERHGTHFLGRASSIEPVVGYGHKGTLICTLFWVPRSANLRFGSVVKIGSLV